MEPLSDSDYAYLVKGGILERPSFWNSGFGRLIRWIVFIPGIYIGLTIVYLVAFAVIGMVQSWFGGKIELSFGVIVFAIVAAIIVLSVGFQFVMMVLFIIGAIPSFFCATVAPNPRLAAPIFGTFYVLFDLYPITKAIGDHEWGTLVFNIVTSVIILFGTKSAYDAA